MNQIQVYKCANVFCNNELIKKPTSLKSLERFCNNCRHKKKGMLSWECKNPDCNNIITQDYVGKLWCDDCILKRHKRRYAAEKILLKLRRIAKKKCKRCHGKIAQPYKWHYCSEYCWWVKEQTRLRRKDFIRSLEAC